MFLSAHCTLSVKGRVFFLGTTNSAPVLVQGRIDTKGPNWYEAELVGSELPCIPPLRISLGFPDYMTLRPLSFRPGPGCLDVQAPLGDVQAHI